LIGDDNTAAGHVRTAGETGDYGPNGIQFAMRGAMKGQNGAIFVQ
jgi:hypothetical protein